MGSIPIDLDRGNKTVSKELSDNTPCSTLICQLLLTWNFPRLPLFPIPEDMERKPNSVFINILVIYLSLNLVVLFSSLKLKRE